MNAAGKGPVKTASPAGKSKRNVPDPFALVIFGASGDLTRRKLIPAVYHLFRQGFLPDGFSVVGFARREKTDESFRAEMREAVQSLARARPLDDATWETFAANLHYHRSNFDDLAGYQSLRQRLERDADRTGVPGNSLYYLATQPRFFVPIVDRLHAAGLVRSGPEAAPWSRVVVEKPFGRDLASAVALNDRIAAVFAEDQIFRIDHYLGKETVQNLLVFRFANSIFEPIWNQKYVDHVQITASERIGVEGRGRYYEQAGALRDMVQNHMMHLLCLVAMESPVGLAPDAVRDEKVKVLRALRPIPRDCVAQDVVRAQYAAGKAGDRDVPGYLEEEDVAPDSTTETYVALKLRVDNWRWAGVPFYLRTGKRLATRLTEISIHFKQVPRVLFNVAATAPMQPNVLCIRIQPNEGISLRFQVKTPGAPLRIRPFQMDFGYSAAFGGEPPEAYERLLLDAALGDPTLFIRRDEVEAAWAFVAPILEACSDQPARRLPQYVAGTWGPREADDLIAADGRRWVVLRRPSPSAQAKACPVVE